MWFFVALSAHVLWSATNMADQYLVRRFRESEASNQSLIIFVGVTSLISGIIIASIAHRAIAQFSLRQIAYLAVSGVIQLTAIWWYLRAFLYDEASQIMAWFLLLPVFGYVAGYLFLGESLTAMQIGGIVIIISGALIFSMHYNGATGKHHVSVKMIACVIAASALMALADAFFKKGSPGAASFWGTIAIHQLGAACIALTFLFFVKIRREFFAIFFGQGPKLLAVNATSEILTLCGNALKYFAILLVPIALAESLEAYQPLIVLLMTIPLAYAAPRYFTLDTSKRSIVLKILGAACLIGGSYLLF